MVSPLITAAELAAALGSVTILDVRHRTGGPDGRAEFDAGHVPGAAYVDLDADLAAPPGEGGRHPLPATEDFQAAMRRAGVPTTGPSSSTTTGRAWPPGAPGGCCASTATATSGCSTGPGRPGSRPGERCRP